MTEDQEKQLETLLKQWFAENKKNSVAFTDNKIGELLRFTLLSLNRWKGLPRGNPRKGLKAMLIRQDSHMANEIEYND